MKEDIAVEKLLNVVELHGIDRRDFLKYCAATAALFGLSEFEFTTKVAHAVESASKKPPVVWIEGQACAGCTISLTQSLYPPAASIVLDKISLRYHGTVMAAAGYLAEEVLDATIKQGGYILIVEGAIPSADDRFWMDAGKPGREIVEAAARKGKSDTCRRRMRLLWRHTEGRHRQRGYRSVRLSRMRISTNRS